jgi:phenylalanyl-tRNA synthetase alpha subunit
MQDHGQLKNEILQKINNSSDLNDLDDVRIQFLGKKGSLTSLMKQLGSFEPEKRKEIGQKLNAIQKEVLEAIALLGAYSNTRLGNFVFESCKLLSTSEEISLSRFSSTTS